MKTSLIDEQPMKRSLINLILMILSGIYLFYSLVILEPSGIQNVLSWGYLSLLALGGWLTIFKPKEDTP